MENKIAPIMGTICYIGINCCIAVVFHFHDRNLGNFILINGFRDYCLTVPGTVTNICYPDDLQQSKNSRITGISASIIDSPPVCKEGFIIYL